MSKYEYLVTDYIGNTLGLFDDMENAIIFINGYFDKHYADGDLKVTIIRQEKV